MVFEIISNYQEHQVVFEINSPALVVIPKKGNALQIMQNALF